jgi:sulfur carrier protein
MKTTVSGASRETMKIMVNGVWQETQASDLAEVLLQLGYGDSVVATALNGEFVPVGSRSVTRLTNGDQLEVLAPMQGG